MNFRFLRGFGPVRRGPFVSAKGPKTIDAQSGSITWSRGLSNVGRPNSLRLNKVRPHGKPLSLGHPAGIGGTRKARTGRGETSRRKLFWITIICVFQNSRAFRPGTTRALAWCVPKGTTLPMAKAPKTIKNFLNQFLDF